jgi:hypothetical protein
MVLSASAVDLLTPRTRSRQYFRGKNESRDASTRLPVRKRTIKLAQRDRRPFEVVASSHDGTLSKTMFAHHRPSDPFGGIPV